MALSPGTRLGPYEVTALIGQGGMGEVYRARDTKLGRDVALKVLPDVFADDPERLARFQREARVLASLNHLNIASIYGLEESEGVRALVLELVEGPTLAERIAPGAIPVDEALPIAKQIAEALEAAHERGVIHRDLKPANVKVKDDGMVKVLDFGLAKALSPEPEGDPSESPTLTAAATRAGVIMGTAAYMSPEQAAGKPVDKRGDIWSFGVVLFEMLTGHRLFTGETVAHVLGAVLQVEPEWDTLPGPTPQPVRKLLQRCLEKDRRRRLRDIGDALTDLDEAFTTGPAGNVATTPAAQAAGWRRTAPWALGTLVVGSIITGLAVWSLPPSSVPVAGSVKRTVITLAEPNRLAFADLFPLGVGRPSLALSPDGTQLVYVVDHDGQTQLYLRPMNGFEARPLGGTEGAFAPFFSPDGEWVGFFTASELKKISLRRGSPVVLCSAGNVYGASWGPDGEIVFADEEGRQLSRVSADGGAPEALLRRDPEQGVLGFSWPQFLPDGRGVLVTLRRGREGPGVAVVSLETGEWRVLVERGTGAHYVPTGHIVYAGDGGILAVPFDLSSLTVTGSAIPVLEDVRREQNGVPHLSVSADGSLAYAPGPDMAIGRPVWVDRNGVEEPIPMPPQRYGMLALSPDGTRLAIVVSARTSDILLYDFERATDAQRLTVQGNNGGPIWTADGERVTYPSNAVGLYWQQVDGGLAEPLLVDDGIPAPVPYSWSPDRVLAFGTAGDIWLMSTDGDPALEPFAETPAHEWGAAFSPNGQWIAYTSQESGQYQVYVKPYPVTAERWTVSSGYGEEPVWSPLGDELFFRRGDQWLSVPVKTEPAFTYGRPEVVVEGPYMNVPGLSYAVSPDAERLILLKGPDQPPATRIHVVANWFEELKALVPVP